MSKAIWSKNDMPKILPGMIIQNGMGAAYFVVRDNTVYWMAYNDMKSSDGLRYTLGIDFGLGTIEFIYESAYDWKCNNPMWQRFSTPPNLKAGMVVTDGSNMNAYLLTHDNVGRHCEVRLSDCMLFGNSGWKYSDLHKVWANLADYYADVAAGHVPS